MIVFLAKATSEGALDWGSEINQYRLTETLKKHAGKTFRLSLPENKRSSRQNSYYWLYLGVIEAETGNDANDLHEYFKRIFLKPKFITVMGEEIKVPKSTKDLNKVEFGEYLDKICAKTNVLLPDPILAGYMPH